MSASETVEDPSKEDARDSRHRAQPGVAIVFSGRAPCFEIIPLESGALELGRDVLADRHIADERLSRRHLRVAFDDGAWTVTDLGSTNGTRVDAVALDRAWSGARPPVIRAGQTLMVPVADITPHVTHGIDTGEVAIVGPQLRAVHERIAAIARSGQNLLITGPSGSGKELGAAAFHRACGQSRKGAERPFVALNCATVPAGLAERILFGAKRGAYSGAVNDTIGLVQAADGGTLFLDEIGELPLDVQAKLLRVIETKQVLPVGAVESTRVDFRVCAATLEDLRAQVIGGRFREDLYFRIGRPEITLPALAARPEEIPWLVQRAIDGVGPKRIAHIELVEQCLLRPWPGNVRELLTEIRCAAALAVDGVVGLDQLSPGAGLSFRAAPSDSSKPSNASNVVDPIEEALRAADGNVSLAAKQLGISRSKVRRFIEKAGIDLDTLRSK